jgi:hypothetical protein
VVSGAVKRANGCRKPDRREVLPNVGHPASNPSHGRKPQTKAALPPTTAYHHQVMSDEKGGGFFVGPIGPIPIVSDDDPRRAAARAASRVAQAAVDCDDLVALVLKHTDAMVRMEAVPRLKARFPNDTDAQEALMHAVTDDDDAVRCAAVSAVADLALPLAGDLLATALNDTEPDVRFFAALGLQQLRDARAPDDPEAFAYRRT